MANFQPLPVEPNMQAWRGHALATYTAGQGAPVLLVHSINAAASAYEVRHPFADLQRDYTTHALDLPGFGLSARPPRLYRATDYIEVLMQMLSSIGQPTILLASSLSSAFAIGAAARLPHLVRALVLVAPVGISQLSQPPTPAQSFTYDLLRGGFGDVVFCILSSPPVVRYYLEQQTYADPARLTKEVLDNFLATTQFPGAKYAPICFVTGMLNYDVRREFAHLSMPILILWGRKLKITPVRYAQEFLATNPQAQLVVIEESALPIEDSPAAFNAQVRAFLAGV